MSAPATGSILSLTELHSDCGPFRFVGEPTPKLNPLIVNDLSCIQNAGCFRRHGNISVYQNSFQEESIRLIQGMFEAAEPTLLKHPHNVCLKDTDGKDPDADYQTVPYSVRYHEACSSNTEIDPEDLVAIFEQSGLSGLANHEHLHRIAQLVSGRTLEPKPVTSLLSMYMHGDYVGLHSDVKWTTQLYKQAGRGEDDTGQLVDAHFTFSNEYVQHQAFLYQSGRHLSAMHYKPKRFGMSVLELPFLHMVTPLEAIPGQEAHARRYLLAVSFQPKY